MPDPVSVRGLSRRCLPAATDGGAALTAVLVDCGRDEADNPNSGRLLAAAPQSAQTPT